MAAECVCFRARRVSRALTRIYDDALRPLGVQTSQLAVLVVVALSPEDGASLGAMADVLVMDRTTLSRNLRPLEKDGLLRITRAREDARVKRVVLTSAGRRVLERGFPLWQEAQRAVVGAMGSGAAADLRRRLDDVIAGVAPLSAGTDVGGYGSAVGTM